MITLRDYQQEAVDAVLAYFERASGNPLLVLPTGAGKSLVLAETIRRAREMHPGTRCLVLCHRKELVEQDARAIQTLTPDTPLGVYSASLGSKQVRDVTVAQYQSARVDPGVFGKIDLIFVDEAHLVPVYDEGTYRDLLRAIPAAVVGLTATPYRLDGGRLTRGRDKVFTSICYDLPVQRLVDAGHLVPIVAPAVSADATVDTRDVHTQGGDFVVSELDEAAQKITRAALAEARELAKDRRSWLVFCVSVAHAKFAADILSDLTFGTVAVVTGETPADERDRVVRRFRSGEVRAVCNVDVLTTGFDAPVTDCLVVLRPTQSTGLYVQMVGRGMRTHPGKPDCLLLDYGGNVERHGPITDVRPRTAGGTPKTWDCPACDEANKNAAKVCAKCKAPKPRPTWPCKECDAENDAATKECAECGRPRPELPREVTHETKATRAKPMGPTVELEPAWLDVDAVRYWRHEKAGKPPSVGVAYVRGTMGRTVAKEWVCPEHGGFATSKFLTWWRVRGGNQPAPATVDETIDRAPRELCPVTAVFVKQDGDWQRVADVKLGERVEREPGCDDDKDGAPPDDPLGGGWADGDDLPF